jgi:hypothetical protein
VIFMDTSLLRWIFVLPRDAERYQPAGTWESGVRRNFPAGPQEPGGSQCRPGGSSSISPTILKGVLFRGRRAPLEENPADKESRIRKHANHCISKEIVANAERSRLAIAIEDLTYAGGFRPQGRTLCQV